MGKEQEAMNQAETIFTENCISNGISVFHGRIFPDDFDIYLLGGSRDMIKYCLDNHINSVFLNFEYEAETFTGSFRLSSCVFVFYELT